MKKQNTNPIAVVLTVIFLVGGFAAAWLAQSNEISRRPTVEQALARLQPGWSFPQIEKTLGTEPVNTPTGYDKTSGTYQYTFQLSDGRILVVYDNYQGLVSASKTN